MGEKSIQKKQYIIEKAKEVFAARGFREVTMKDLVEGCEISRGGLYLYFADTAEVFEAILKDNGNDLAEILKNDKDNPADVILEYLEAAKNILTAKKNNLCAATIEYRFAIKAAKKDSVIKKQLSASQSMLEKLITTGVKKKQMSCDNPAVAAKNIILALDGLSVAAGTSGVTAAEVDKEINCLMGTVGLVVK